MDEGKLKIAEIQPPLATKKPRALPHVWAKFYRLANGETFSINGDKAIKVAFCGFRRYARPNCFVNDWGKQSQFEFIAPWRRVKTNVLVRKPPSLPVWTENNSKFVREITPRRDPFVFKNVDPLPGTSIEQTGPSA